jgi:hypothetical protein
MKGSTFLHYPNAYVFEYDDDHGSQLFSYPLLRLEFDSEPLVQNYDNILQVADLKLEDQSSPINTIRFSDQVVLS